MVVAYDVSNEQSFVSCVKWLERVRAQKPAVETQLPGILYTPDNCCWSLRIFQSILRSSVQLVVCHFMWGYIGLQGYELSSEVVVYCCRCSGGL